MLCYLTAFYSDSWCWGIGLLNANYLLLIWRIYRYQSTHPGSPCRLKQKVTHMVTAAPRLDRFGLQTTSRIWLKTKCPLETTDVHLANVSYDSFLWKKWIAGVLRFRLWYIIHICKWILFRVLSNYLDHPYSGDRMLDAMFLKSCLVICDVIRNIKKKFSPIVPKKSRG